MAVGLDDAYELHPDVALRPEPFGALAYHYGNRRLVFLNHRDMVDVVRDLAGRPNVASSLRHCRIDEERWPAFVAALSSLESSGVVRARDAAR
jgi:putative mycofactocin binding protein MftB